MLTVLPIACRSGAHSRNVLSLDIEAVGLLRHGERFASGDLGKGYRDRGRGVAAG
jgi:hypothetical protein